MDKAGQYRAFAAECVHLAAEIADSASKARLIDMASAWLRLAEHAENAAVFTLIAASAQETENESTGTERTL